MGLNSKHATLHIPRHMPPQNREFLLVPVEILPLYVFYETGIESGYRTTETIMVRDQAIPGESSSFCTILFDT